MFVHYTKVLCNVQFADFGDFNVEVNCLIAFAPFLFVQADFTKKMWRIYRDVFLYAINL